MEKNIFEIIYFKFKAIFTGRMNNWKFFKIQFFLYLINLFGTKASSYVPYVNKEFGQLPAQVMQYVIATALACGICLCVVSYAKRFHDINLSGYFAIIAFPLVFIDELFLLSCLVSIILIWWPGSKVANKYGEIPN
ncbi:MAG TPA: DUF805 domain-containing protein [Methylotenera sp.]|nr:DUF805 domain-containing protein [Methylotenera sp.]HPH07993.1 DUF805 domain-containing protein [Methylotenera sp.]HPM50034.1 DUF805 domain-containing protein [Methylotenera sp.]